MRTQARAPKLATRLLTPLAALPLALAIALPSPAVAQSQRTVGDVLSLAIPVATVGTELFRGDREGALQYALTFATATGGTEVLKRVTRVERPDGSNSESFPSGHAARAFSAAAYVRARHGLESAAPLYLAALYVGHSRVAADRHRWVDVLGAAVLSELSAAWLVQRAGSATIVIAPAIGHRSVGASIAAVW